MDDSQKVTSPVLPGGEMPVRVCLIAPSMDILGGQSVQARRLLDELADSDVVKLEFLPVNPRLGGIFGRLQRIKYVRTLITSVAYVASLFVRVRQADVVHAYSASYWSYLLAPLPAMIVARLFGKPCILNYHSGEADDHLSRWRRTGTPTIRRFATVVVVPSDYLVDVFARHGVSAVKLENALSASMIRYRRRTHLKPRFLSNRNLEPMYNVSCVIESFAHIQSQFPEASLVIAGSGSERQRLEELVARLELRNVLFAGRVAPDAMPKLYAEADVYLNSPNIDNAPLSILEAFAAGVPVVTTDAGGIPYIVESGRNGIVVGCGDASAMARAAISLLEFPESSVRLTDEGLADFRKVYSWDVVRPKWESLYSRLASGSNRSSD